MAPVIRAQRLTKTWPGGRRALDGIDLELPGGELIGLIGANGSGKSTLLKILFGIVKPDEGALVVLDLDPAGAPRSLHRLAGYSPQSPALDPELTGGETLNFLSALYDPTGELGTDPVLETAQTFGIKDRLNELVQTYSGGLKQRLHLASAFLHNPRLLLLDEPTNGLDPQGQADIWRLLKERTTRGGSALVSTHDLANAGRHCNRILLLSQGRLLANDTPQNLVANHGRTILELQTRDRIDESQLNPSLLKEGLVERVVVKGSSATIALRQQEIEPSAILKPVRDLGLEILSYQLKLPDLESAYFQLAGESLNTSKGEQKPQGGRRRR